MANSKIRDRERRLQRLGILGIATGVAVIGGNLAMLILISDFRPWALGV